MAEYSMFKLKLAEIIYSELRENIPGGNIEFGKHARVLIRTEPRKH